MLNKFLLNDELLITQVEKFFIQQRGEWNQCKNGYDSLNSVETKIFKFDDIEIRVQFNPGRITSTSANVDEKSISERKCFLCVDNLPQDQNGIQFENDFVLLVNPFPIFPEHYTIPFLTHQPQLLLSQMNSFLDLTKALSNKYVLFYNGPKCGASAPDHLHFQAGTKNFMPIDNEIYFLKEKYSIAKNKSDEIEFSAISDPLRKYISIHCRSKEKILKVVEEVLEKFNSLIHNDIEPMINVLSYYRNGFYELIIMLRKKHRPKFYFEDGENKFVISPASVDVGGVLITPRKEDFERINEKIIKEIFDEIFISDDELKILAAKLHLS